MSGWLELYLAWLSLAVISVMDSTGYGKRSAGGTAAKRVFRGWTLVAGSEGGGSLFPFKYSLFVSASLLSPRRTNALDGFLYR